MSEIRSEFHYNAALYRKQTGAKIRLVRNDIKGFIDDYETDKKGVFLGLHNNPQVDVIMTELRSVYLSLKRLEDVLGV